MHGTARLVLTWLAIYADDDGMAWPTVGRLAKDCNLAERSVRLRVADLVVAGRVAITECPGKANRYRLYPEVPRIPVIRTRGIRTNGITRITGIRIPSIPNPGSQGSGGSGSQGSPIDDVERIDLHRRRARDDAPAERGASLAPNGQPHPHPLLRPGDVISREDAKGWPVSVDVNPDGETCTVVHVHDPRWERRS